MMNSTVFTFKTLSSLTTPTNGAGSSQPGVQELISNAETRTHFPSYDRAAVEKAMLLLMYAAEHGKKVDETTRKSILDARAGEWDDTRANNLLAALAQISSQLSPVTAESIRASCDQSKPTISSLRKWTIILAIPIILFSLLSFVSSSISTAIRSDVTTANELAVKLRAELGSPQAPTGGTPEKPALPKGLNEADVIAQLQQYASTVRAIDTRARQLNLFVFRAEPDPFARYRWNPKQSEEQREQNQRIMKQQFQLEVALTNLPEAADKLTTTYQDVRSFAQNILDLVSVSYGAITTCILPVLYALLGTCAYLLRCFEEELRNVTFTPSSRANLARFFIAAIGGAVVGLFGNFTITQGASISPLAIAFLVGYAVDVFFSFLEALLQAFTKTKNAATSGASSS